VVGGGSVGVGGGSLGVGGGSLGVGGGSLGVGVSVGVGVVGAGSDDGVTPSAGVVDAGGGVGVTSAACVGAAAPSARTIAANPADSTPSPRRTEFARLGFLWMRCFDDIRVPCGAGSSAGWA
jgi:hypothetical protein